MLSIIRRPITHFSGPVSSRWTSFGQSSRFRLAERTTHAAVATKKNESARDSPCFGQLLKKTSHGRSARDPPGDVRGMQIALLAIAGAQKAHPLLNPFFRYLGTVPQVDSR